MWIIAGRSCRRRGGRKASRRCLTRGATVTDLARSWKPFILNEASLECHVCSCERSLAQRSLAWRHSFAVEPGRVSNAQRHPTAFWNARRGQAMAEGTETEAGEGGLMFAHVPQRLAERAEGWKNARDRPY